MKTLEYTPRILTLISAGKKLEAVKMAKDLYGLSLQEAKNMIDSYRPGGNNWYTTMELNDTPEYTPDIIELINEGKTLDVILMLKDRYGLSAEDAKKMIDNYPKSKTITKPVESTTPASEGKQDFIANNDAHFRKCPCCQKQIEGRLDSPKLRQGAKIGSKFAVKQGINMITGTSVASAAGAVGATIGSVIPVVGTFLGYVAGYAVGHVAQEMALDYAYDAVEEKYATKKYYYNCPDCNLTWDSTETNDRNIIIRNLVEYYKLNKKDLPQKPEAFRLKNYKKSENTLVFSIVGIIMVFLVPVYHKPKDPYAHLKPELSYGDWIGITMPFVVVFVFIIIGIVLYLFNEKNECDKKLEAYKKEVQEIKEYNSNLHDSLVSNFNNVIRNNKPRLGVELQKLPI